MVLQSILQGILQRQFGKYLQNFDKQQINVGIWKGDIELRNMEVNQNVVNDLDLPVKIRFGLVNRLTMNVPWTQLSTSPVIINLDGLYILLESESKKNWKPIRTASLQEKEAILNAFTAAFLKDLEGEQPEQNKNQGYIQRLSMRVVDNLQIKVRNIHIRYEDTQFSMEPFAFGITLKALDLQTTNQEWEQQFFDRTIEANKSIPLRKRLKLMDFSMYLEEEPHRLFIKEGSIEDNKYTQRVSEQLKLLIPEEIPDFKRALGDGIVDLQKCCLIRPINLEAKLTWLQRALEPGEARMHAELTIKEIQVYMRKKQFVHLAYLVDVADDFRDSCITTHHQKFRIFLPAKRLSDKTYQGDRHKLVRSWWQFAGRSMLANIKYRKGNYRAFEMSRARFMLLQKDFSALYYKKLKKKDKKNLSKEDQIQLERIIYVVGMEILQDWVKKITKVYYEDQQVKKDRLKGVKDFFSGIGGFFSKKPKEEVKEENEDQEQKEVKDPDEESIDKILTELGDQELYASHFVKSSDINLRADFCLEQASLILEIQKQGEPFDGRNSEGVRMSLGKSVLQAIQLENKKIDLRYSLRDFGVELFSVQKSSHERDSIVYKQSEKIQNIFELNYRQNPSKEMEFDITLFPLTLVFQQLLVQRIVSYFKVPNLQFSDQAYDQLKTFKVGTQDKMQDTFYGKNNKLVLKIMSPNLLVPFQRNRDFNSPTWCINLGDIVLTNVSNLIKVSETLDPNFYQPFNLSIDHFCLTFYQTMKTARAFSHLKSFSLAMSQISKNTSSVADERGVDVICPFTLNLLLGLRKKKIHDPKLAKVQINGELSDIKIQVTPQLFNDFVNIDECFKIDEDENWEQLLSSKNEIIKLAKKISSIKRRTYFTWINTFAVMSGGYIYFYDNQKDVSHTSYFFLRQCNLTRKKTSSADEFQYVLMLSNKYNDECELAFKARMEIDIWENIINQQVVEMSPNKQRRLQSEKYREMEAQELDFNTVIMNFGFRAPGLQLVLKQASFQDWVHLDLVKFDSNVILREGDFTLHFQLAQVLLEAYNNVRYPQLITSDRLQIGNKPILDFTLKHFSKNAPFYRDLDFQIDINVGSAHSNFNPHQIHEVIVYLTNIEVNKLRYHRAESLMPQDREPSLQRQSLLEQIARIKQEERDKQNEPFELTFEVQVSFSHVSLLALNPYYNSPFVQLEVGATKFEYYRRRDHELVIGKFGNLQLIDKTFWPNTIDPSEFKYEKSEDGEERDDLDQNESEGEDKKQEELELVGPRILPGEEDKGGIIQFELKIMKNICAQKEEGIKNVCKVEMHSFQVVYFQQLTFRFMDYFFDQFLEAITTQPVTDKEKDVKHKMTPTEK